MLAGVTVVVPASAVAADAARAATPAASTMSARFVMCFLLPVSLSGGFPDAGLRKRPLRRPHGDFQSALPLLAHPYSRGREAVGSASRSRRDASRGGCIHGRHTGGRRPGDACAALRHPAGRGLPRERTRARDRDRGGRPPVSVLPPLHALRPARDRPRLRPHRAGPVRLQRGRLPRPPVGAGARSSARGRRAGPALELRRAPLPQSRPGELRLGDRRSPAGGRTTRRGARLPPLAHRPPVASRRGRASRCLPPRPAAPRGRDAGLLRPEQGPPAGPGAGEPARPAAGRDREAAPPVSERLDRRDFLERAALVAGTVGIVPRWALAGSSDPRLKELARSIQGSVVSPGASGYRAARILSNPRFDGIRPRAVVLAESSTDVAKAILWARKYSIPLTPRSGGHSYGGFSTTTGVVVDVTRMNAVSVDSVKMRAA